MSYTRFFLIKTTMPRLFILFSLLFVVETINGEHHHNGGGGSAASAARDDGDGIFFNDQQVRSQEDNIAAGDNEPQEVIRRAKEQFVGGADGSHMSELAPEVLQVQASSQAVDANSGSSFSYEQHLNDDGSISAPSFSLNKKGSVTASFNGPVLATTSVPAAAAAAAATAAATSESNPLIESGVSNAAALKLKRYRRASRHRPLGGQIDGYKYWCHRNCPTIKHSRVCASDGRLYGSLCELMRQSCLQNVRLSKRPASHCALQMNRNEAPNLVDVDDLDNNTDGSVDDGDDDDDDDQGNNNYDHDDDDSDGLRVSRPPFSKENDLGKLNIVELKGSCNRAKVEDMKLLLLRQFGGELETIFEYFDSNNDQFIEAHELWPKRDASGNKSALYAQAWDDHSNKCQVAHSGFKSHIKGDKTKCWFFLDFPFEPKYPSNPCSLSHLILFDLEHPASRFTRDTFQRAFQNVLSLYNNHNNHNNSNNNNNDSDASSNLKQNQLNLIKLKTKLYIGLGKTIKLNCLPNSTNQIIYDDDNPIDDNGGELYNPNNAICLWTRYNSNIATRFDPHILVKRQNILSANKTNFRDLSLHIKDAQLYLSGQFKCSCTFKNRIEHNIEHIYDVHVLATPRVSVRPKFQWSLPHSRVSFECQYDHIDTSSEDNTSIRTRDAYKLNSNETDEANGQFGIQIKWMKENQNLIAESKMFTNPNFDDSHTPSSSSWSKDENNQSSWRIPEQDDQFYSPPSDQQEHQQTNPTRPETTSSSLRASITMAASRLTLEDLQLNDTGYHTCRVEVPVDLGGNASSLATSMWLMPIKNDDGEANVLVGEANGSLLVQEQPITDQSDGSDERLAQLGSHLWMFHDNGISVYKLQNDDGQEMELVREINGHSLVNGEVDGNWNQLTLCGGLNPEQVVICEWSDNAVRLEVNHGSNAADPASREDKLSKASLRKYIYVGQPNLNRIVVLDGLRFEIVAIVNTEPQPRKLHLYKPNKVHLSKWVRRRLSPVANARWLAAIGTHAHSLKSTPVDSRLYSHEPGTSSKTGGHHQDERLRRRRIRSGARRAYPSSANQLPSALIQHDIWLLCYGQPLVVDPSGRGSGNGADEDETFERASQDSYEGAPIATNNLRSTFDSSSDNITITATSSNLPSGSKHPHKLASNVIQPFTPRLSPPFIWPIWSGATTTNNKESELRNRKSVHIIQSTFFPQAPTNKASFHSHEDEDVQDEEGSNGQDDNQRNHSKATPTTLVGEFKRSTVLTTHHIITSLAGLRKSKHTGRAYIKRMATNNHHLDLLQDLFVPSKPYSLELNDHHKIHYAYVTHYDERRLFRVSMDDYRYDQEIDLENCDPINLMTTAQGLIIVQCRTLITHNLIGQLVLDQLTSSPIEFNANIRAQESYLSPDNRYLISIYNNSTLSSNNQLGNKDSSPGQQKRSAPRENQRQQQQQQQQTQDHSRRQASVVYVQLVTVSGLKLQYEIKTALEMSQCSFVWKDGYYAAILVSTNRREKQSEILSLRLADSRLELMARVPGVISKARHKEQLIVSQELRLAALSTNQGTYVVDLEDNRVSQSLRYHQSPPTLLWV